MGRFDYWLLWLGSVATFSGFLVIGIGLVGCWITNQSILLQSWRDTLWVWSIPLYEIGFGMLCFVVFGAYRAIRHGKG